METNWRGRMFLEQATWLALQIDRRHVRSSVEKWTVVAITRAHDDPTDAACYSVTATAPDGIDHKFCVVEEWDQRRGEYEDKRGA